MSSLAPACRLQPPAAGHIRWIIRGNGLSGIGPAEYFTVNTPNTKGHAMANGCNGTAAYSVFRMSIPEYFTSPGPATVYFDNDGQPAPDSGSASAARRCGG